MKLKLRILNKFGASQILGSPDEIEAEFPYSEFSLVKRMSLGAIKILDDVKGEIEVEISDFEVQGMPEGDAQSFLVKIKTGSHFREALFQRCLNVRTMDVKGQSRKVIEK